MTKHTPETLAEAAAAAVLAEIDDHVAGTQWSTPLETLAWNLGREALPFTEGMARFAAAAAQIAAARAEAPEAASADLTLTTSRTVTSDEVVDLVEGTGALSMPWWITVDRHTIGNALGYYVQHWRGAAAGDEGTHVVTVVSDAQIVAAASRYLALNPDTSLDLSDSLGDADSLHADNILQIAVYGSIIFG